MLGLAGWALAPPAATAEVADPAPTAAPGAATAATAAAPQVAPEVASYDVGLMLGRQLYQNGLRETIRQDALVRGLKDGLAGRIATSEQSHEAGRFIQANRDALTAINEREARAFLARNAQAAGVVTLASGLQYRVLADGAGAAAPRATDEVTVRYRAALADGTELDSSHAHGHAATVRVGSVIKGWREALLSMKPGARWQLFVPPDLGYGAAPPPAFPPGALLIYELELVGIEPPRTVDPSLLQGARPRDASVPKR